MPAEVLSEKTREYLDKHQISSLFDDLKTKIIKELPSSPIDFLILKLQALKLKKPTQRPATSSGPVGSRSAMQVTGTAVSSTKQKATGGAGTSKTRPGLGSSSSPSLTKTKPSAKTSAPGSPLGSKLKPAPGIKRPTTAPATSKASPAKSSGLKSPSKLSSSSSSSLSKATSSKSPRTGLKPPGTQAARTASPAATKKSIPPSRTGLSKPRESKTTANKSQPSSSTGSPVKAVSKKVAESTLRYGSEEYDEFGTASRSPAATKKSIPPNKSLSKPVSKKPRDSKTTANKSQPSSSADSPVKVADVSKLVTEDKLHCGSEEDDEFGVTNSSTVDSDEESEVRGGDQGEDCDTLESLLQMKASGKELKTRNSCTKSKQRLQQLGVEEDLSVTPPSLGYHSGSGEGCEEDSEDECSEAMEDPAVLEDEGVISKSKKVSSKDTKVEFMVLLCSQCAKMLTGEEPMEKMSAIVVTEGATFPDFESASQVGSHASFPQWEVETEKDSEVSSVDKWKSSSIGSSTNVTLVSRDTWGGLAPKNKPQLPPSDEESEVQFIPHVPLTGQPWNQETSSNPHGWGES